jgi:hypothetical protein
MEADFSGYATKAGLKCSDGRTITAEAFKHQDKIKVPLVWQHIHDEPTNVLGYAILEHRDESHPEGAGTYCYGYFNDTAKGQDSKKLVQHEDITFLSIYANQLVEKLVGGAKQVLHGAIREVSLVLAGANPGAKIDFVAVQHGDDDVTEFDDEAFITTGLAIAHAADAADSEEGTVEHGTYQEVYDSLSDEQKDLVHFMIGEAFVKAEADSTDDAAAHSDDDSGSDNGDAGADAGSDDGDDKSADENSEDNTDDTSDTDSGDDTTGDNTDDGSGATTTEGDLNHQEGSTNMNVFDSNGVAVDDSKRLTHSQLVTIVENAKKPGGSFKDALLAHADEYGVTDINLLFPDAKALTTTPEFISRRMEWVAAVLNGTKHSPFAKVKTLLADITEPEARAKGYIKGNRKKEEVFKLLKRTTGPATIYKKQKLDRDDILDITDIDVVNWLKAEMRLMIEEEIARAILVGDGRSSLDEDKVKDPEGAIDGTGIRSILHDDDLYSIKRELAANVSPKDAVKGLVRARSKYRGSGKPTLFISDAYLTDIMLEEDKFGRPLYETEQALADKLRVKEIVTVDLFDEYDNLFAIMVSLQDYTIGSNRGGELTSFEDFDIDFNQHKYLQETRLSGGLTKPFSAVVVMRAQGTKATVQQPSFNGATDTITIPTTAGVQYTINDEVVEGDVVITSTTEVEAEPEAGFYLETNSTRSWTYTP